MRLQAKIIIFVLMLLSSGLFSAKYVRAGTWGEDIMAEEMGQMQDAIEKQIYGVIMGALKQAAVKAIEGQISNITSGGGSGTGGAMFVTNWQEYLYKQPAEKTQLYMKDFLTTLYGGKGSSSNYTSASKGNYTGYIEKEIKAVIEGKSSQGASSEEKSISSQIFSDPSKGWRQFDALIEYNPAQQWLEVVQPALMAISEREKKKAEIQAIAYQSFLPTTEGGSGGGLFGSSGSGQEPTVTTPGIITKEIQAQVEDLPNKVLADARDIPEVITALVTRIITKTITQGIGKASENAQRNNSSTGSSNNQSSNSNFGIFGNFGQ